MKLTYDEYIKNPSGGATVTNRNILVENFRARFDGILVRFAGKISTRSFKASNQRYLCYVKVPSEVVKDFFYDVVVEFYTTDSSLENSLDLKKYNVRFYSNDPFFSFTFGYAYNKNDLFIKELSPRISDMVLTTKAVVRNPKDEIDYVKALVFAYFAIKHKNLFNKNLYTEKYDRSILLDNIMHAEKKINLRTSFGNMDDKLVTSKEKKETKKETSTATVSKHNTKTSGIAKTSTISHKKPSTHTTKKTNRTKKL